MSAQQQQQQKQQFPFVSSSVNSTQQDSSSAQVHNQSIQQINQSFLNQQMNQMQLITKRQITSSQGNNEKQHASDSAQAQQRLKSVNLAVDIYKGSLPKPKSNANYQSNQANNSIVTNQNIGQKLNTRKQLESNSRSSQVQQRDSMSAQTAMVGSGVQSATNQQQSAAQRLLKNFSRNNIEKRQSISFDKPNPRDLQFLQKNPYLASAKAAVKNQKTSQQKLKDKSYSILTSNGVNQNSNPQQVNLKLKHPQQNQQQFSQGYDMKLHRNNSLKQSPKSNKMAGQINDLSVNQGIQNALCSDKKLPNLKHKKEKSLERNNSVFNRRDLIKQEYNRVIETRLPNILSLMSNGKQNIASASGADISLFENENMDYDDTELLSKLFTKDHNKSGHINMSELQQTLQNKNDKSRYQRKQTVTGSRKKNDNDISKSSSQDRAYDDNRFEQSQRKLSIENRPSKLLHSLNNKKVAMASITPDQDYICETIINEKNHDEDLGKLDKLQLINASARFELLSANQQLLDFHLNRIVNKKYQNKKSFKAVQGQKGKINQEQMIVCEDFENESDRDSQLGKIYDVQEQSNRQRIKQMGNPHNIMQEQDYYCLTYFSRLNSMNPLSFGDTIRLPVLAEQQN
ncbi:UNKNOWN [Stylonychia lemnae]|uniref:EF-hand domain-containing protein n=1 Tax=Stylonychia lemnae TaxID=5949 RepID=A0A078AAM8_STYLE|nr:UNKNOWN [Stylonychia lemnae]|eukprot:CDW78642.1 UNKNOWN [Stylonychia lemnae]